MDIFEFQLRFQAYQGLSRICKLWRAEEILIKMVTTSSKWIPAKNIQDISPEELRELTKDTYSTYKVDILEKNNNFTKDFTEASFYYPLSVYVERLEYELKVIKEMWFHTYMLVVSDFVNRAKKNSIMVWPGRWSGAWSLLAYAVGITDVNPFAYDLLFERFLNPARISMPDFDIDFEDTFRDKVIDYVTHKYGTDKVCAIGTYMKLASKAAFKDAARAIGIPFERSNEVSNLLWEIVSLKTLQIDDNNSEVNADLRNLYQQDKYVKSAIDQGAHLEGNLRQLGVHACGVIISPDPVTQHTATQIILKWKKETLVSQFDWPTLEYIGLLKMDFLWLRNLSVIKNCIKIIQAKYKIIDNNQDKTQYLSDQYLFEEFSETMSFNPPLNDHIVFEQVFETGDTTGIFQFEWEWIRRFLIDLKPNHINDLVAMNALYRPGPLEFIPTYIKRKHGEEKVEYMLPELIHILQSVYKSDDIIQDEKRKLEEDLWPIMNLTYGIAVYQEQLMFLVQSMAWFSLPEADLLRRWIGKKKKEVIEQLKKEFVHRAESYKWYKKETSTFIYEKMIEPAASYSFNKSHAVCYAHIAYQTWYLKAHYPVEFYAGLLRSVEEDTDKLWLFIEELEQHSIPIYKPNINRSYNHIAAIDDGVMMGFFACKGIGYEIGEIIEKERKDNGLFKSLEDFLTRCYTIINKKSLESLIKAWAFDEWYDRNTLLANIDQLLDWNKSNEIMSMGLFWSDTENQKIEFKKVLTTNAIDTCKYDMEIFKTNISWHPLDGLYLYCKRFGFISQYKDQSEPGPFSVIAMIKKITRAKKKGFFILVEDATDSFEFFVKELLDLKVYNVLIISWYKARSRGIDTMIKLSLEELLQQATKANKFDPYWTVARVRKERKRPEKQVKNSYSWNTIIEPEDNNKLWEQNIDLWEQTTSIIVWDWDEEVSLQHDETTWPIMITLPDSLEKINILLNIIQSHPSTDKVIIVWGKEYSITSQALELIQSL